MSDPKRPAPNPVVLNPKLNLTADELRVVWAALRAMLSWCPSIEPDHKHLESAFYKFNRKLGGPGLQPISESQRAKGIDQ